MTEPQGERDRRADEIRRQAFERAGQHVVPWDEIPEAERERWRRAVGDQPRRSFRDPDAAVDAAKPPPDRRYRE